MDNLRLHFAQHHHTSSDANLRAQYVMLKSAPPVDAALVEHAELSALEITIAWGDNVLHVAHLTPPRSFYLGEEASDFLVPREALGAARVPVVIERGGAIYLAVPSGAEGRLVDAAGATPLSEVASTPSVEQAGAHEILLAPGQRATLKFAGLTIRVAAVQAGKAAPRGISGREGRAVGAYFGVSFLIHAAFIAAMAHFVPPVGLLDDEGAKREQVYALQAYLAAAAEREEQREERAAPTHDSAGAPEQEPGQRAAGDEGKLGKVDSKATGGRYGVKGPRDNPDPHLARTREFAANFGMVGLLSGGAGDPDAPTAPFGRDTSLGRDDLSAQGNMWGASIHESGGAGGLGLSGLGEMGGGFGAGIGLGDVGTIGGVVGRCGVNCQGMGGGFASGTNGHTARAPRIRPEGVTETSGRLPAETIQRVVRQNFGQFRMCYENGLRTNPNLAGRVAVRFVISSDGRVTNAANGGSDLPDAGVVSCVVRGFYSLGFPAPESGVVTVVYPIQFSPG